jgi:hypothetical protein
MGAVQNCSQTVLIEKLLSNDSDADNDTITLTGVSATSTNGGSITMTIDEITYSPVSGFHGTDRFTYTISDGRGGIATATVVVEVLPTSAAAANIISITPSAGHFIIRFTGIPYFVYTVQRSTDLVNWAAVGDPVLIPELGIAEFEDTAPPPGAAFYRVLVHW